MKFHRVSLRDYKAIRSFVIEPRETGVTIIEGENEVGKSSIAEALWLVFDQTDDSSSAVGAQQRDDLAFLDVEVDAEQHLSTAVAGVEVADQQQVCLAMAALVQRLATSSRR